MKRTSQKDEKKRKYLGWWRIATLFLAVALYSIIDSYAYYTDLGAAENYLRTQKFEVVLKDVFDNGNLSLPGDTLNKDVFVQNTGQVDAVTRVKLTPTWNPEADEAGKLYDPTVVEIRYGEPIDNWVKIEDWYYYTRILQPGETSSKLVEELTLTLFSNDHHFADYTQATYTLEVLSQSLQALPESTMDNWNMGFRIGEEGIVWSENTTGGP